MSNQKKCMGPCQESLLFYDTDSLICPGATQAASAEESNAQLHGLGKAGSAEQAVQVRKVLSAVGHDQRHIYTHLVMSRCYPGSSGGAIQ